MKTMLTPGTWRVGKKGGTVVSDQPLPGYCVNGGHDDVEYYGGYLIAESIWRAEDACGISALPDLLKALIYLRDCIESGAEPGMGVVHAAIRKATGCQP